MSILKMVTASVALALVAGFALSTVNGSSRSHGSIFSVTTYDHHMPVQVYGANEYGDSDYGAQYPWVQDKILVEPYKLATLTAVGSAVEQAATITWTFGTDVQFGSESQYQFIIPGDYSMVLSITDSETGSKTVSTVAVICAYVKREVRSLHDDDRVAFLMAASQMWTLSTKEGQEKYGEDFIGMDRVVQVHTDQATGSVYCDHWHEGTGFLTHHLALSASFEYSLRAIDPRVTTPYWDFTIDGEKIQGLGGGPSMLTSVNDFFTDKFFGGSDGNSHVVDGVWAHTRSVHAHGDSVSNSYGYIRAPWNNNPDKELTRHMFDVCGLEPINKPIPTCATHFTVMNQTDLGTFLATIAGYGHGPMHVNTGGVFGGCTGAMTNFYNTWEEDLKVNITMADVSLLVEEKFGFNPDWQSVDEFSLKELVQKVFHLEYFHMYRMLWRSQTCALDKKPFHLTCPESCSEDTPEDECLCTCRGTDDLTTFDWQNLEPCMYASNTTKWMFQSVFDDRMRKDMLTTLCTAGVKQGEQLESASPLDPVFWMIHPVLDRMITAKRLAGESLIPFGSFGDLHMFEDESWVDYSYYTTNEYRCSGHGENDAVLHSLGFGALEDLADEDGNGVVSNQEFYDITNPLKHNIDYVYDNFAWPHCDSDINLDLDTQSDYPSMYQNGALHPDESSIFRLFEKSSPFHGVVPSIVSQNRR